MTDRQTDGQTDEQNCEDALKAVAAFVRKNEKNGIITLSSSTSG